MSKTPTKINEYLVLPIKLPDRIVESTLHYLYLRRHAPKVATPSDSRSLFAVNVPIDSTEAHLRGLFLRIGGGMVDSVVFDGEDKNKRREEAAPAESKKRKRVDDADVEAAATVMTWDRKLRRSGSTAVVVFVDKASVEITLKAISKATKGKKQGEVPVWGEGISDANKIPALGISRYLTHHNLRFPSKIELQSSIDAFMTIFNEQEAENARALARRRQEPDEDGFITVVRGGRVAPARQEEAAALAKKKGEKEAPKNFYRFQTREVRKERHQQLLAKFEMDKKKVAERKNMRKFKPL
ncbi:uncharacterized protein LAJ45_05735 [Morchella importuna]|uniref:uncharacterized protein n=1 Tax=Morchella importuna TaxID=1174673 RepID=UPI001E8EEEA6|nr:uncharacterized protein LAJ45_05735 [Morchella importuna]KAH8150049.1 hypothetical protein LAJ45_05735 [Morchella importuna]